MPNDESEPPVVKALHCLLGQGDEDLAEAERSVRIFSYHETRDFNRLWSFDGLVDKPEIAAKPFLIFWKGFPAHTADGGATSTDSSEPDRVAINSYVTPYHWALACSLRARACSFFLPVSRPATLR